MKRRGRPRRLRPVDSHIQDIDDDALEMLTDKGDGLDADLRRMAVESTGPLFAVWQRHL